IWELAYLGETSSVDFRAWVVCVASSRHPISTPHFYNTALLQHPIATATHSSRRVDCQREHSRRRPTFVVQSLANHMSWRAPVLSQSTRHEAFVQSALSLSQA